MIIETRALFLAPDGTEDPADHVAEICGEVIEQDEEKLYPTRFVFDFCDVVAINTSSHFGYTCINMKSGEGFSIEMDFDKAKRLFQLCH